MIIIQRISISGNSKKLIVERALLIISVDKSLYASKTIHMSMYQKGYNITLFNVFLHTLIFVAYFISQP